MPAISITISQNCRCIFKSLLLLRLFVLFIAHCGHKVPLKVIYIALLVQEELLVFLRCFRSIFILELEALDLYALQAHLLQLLRVIDVYGDVCVLQRRLVQAALVAAQLRTL